MSPTLVHTGPMLSLAMTPLYATGSALGHAGATEKAGSTAEEARSTTMEVGGAPERMDPPLGSSEEYRGGRILCSSDCSSSLCLPPAPRVRVGAACFCAPCAREGARLRTSSSAQPNQRTLPPPGAQPHLHELLHARLPDFSENSNYAILYKPMICWGFGLLLGLIE